MFRFFICIISAVISLPALPDSVAHAATLCDFDGDGMSEFVVLTLNGQGTYDWSSYNPRTGEIRVVAQAFGTASSKFIPGNWINPGQAVPAIVDPVGTDPHDRATWTLKSLDYLDGAAVSKSLGRAGDIVILGGDYDGNDITDSLILKKTTGMLGLRVNYFLASYNGNNLGKERLYKALGAPFRDTNLFFSPDGNADYLAVLQRNARGARVVLLKAFTDTPKMFSIGRIPNGARAPLPIKQRSGEADNLLFYSFRNGQTQLVVKNISGRELYNVRVPGADGVSVGDYFNDHGWEIGVQSGDSITVVNPRTKSSRLILRPSGRLVSCVSNQTIE